MKIPFPENPAHVKNLASIPLLEAQGFTGSDASLAESIFEYGLAWRDIGNGEMLFVHHASHGKAFDRTVFKTDLDVQKEFNWAKLGDLAQWCGTPLDEWLALPLTLKISDLVNYYGVEEIFGTTYWQGFQISPE